MQKLFGSLMLGCGIIVAGLSGLCTLLVVGTTLGGSPSAQETMSVIPPALIFGGIPLLIGVGLWFAGRAVLRSSKEDETRGL